MEESKRLVRVSDEEKDPQNAIFKRMYEWSEPQSASDDERS